MTYNQALEELRSVKELQQYVSALHNRVIALQSSVLYKGLSYDNIGGRSSVSSGNSVEKGYEKLIELTDKYNHEIDNLIEREDEIREKLFELGKEKPIYASLLLRRYIDLRTVEDCMSSFNYSKSRILQLQKEAINYYADMY